MSEPQPKSPPVPGEAEQGEVSHEADRPAGGASKAAVDEERETFVHDDGPKGDIHVRVSGRTDVGLVREHNEDNYLIVDLESGTRDPGELSSITGAGLLLGVCDGMGGAAAGEVASQMAVDTISEIMRESVPAADRDGLARALVRSIEEAGGRIFEEARTDRSRRGMGTTATVATLMDRTLFVGQVGDSRAYILRAGELKQLTKDQSLVNQLIEAGQLTEDEAEAFEHSNIILQALGTTEHVSVDLTFMELRRGDRLLMCSDGLSGLVHGDVIREVLAEQGDLDECCERLIELAKAGGGHDNVTVILAEFSGDGLAAPQEGDLIGYQQYPLPLDPEPSEGERLSRQTFPPTLGSSGPPRRLSRESVAYRSDAPARGPWKHAAAAALAALGAGAVYLLTCAEEPNQVPEQELVSVDAEPVTPPPAPADVEIVVRTDAEASELMVDGEPQGPAVDGRWVLGLLPGPHKLEALASGVSITSTVVEVRKAHPTTVFLSMPEGEDVAEPADETVVREPARARRERRRRRALHDAAAAGGGAPTRLGAAHKPEAQVPDPPPADDTP